MRSLYSGVSGLKIHQTKMDVIANNISNVNTTAYKSGRVTFSDYFSQTLSSAQSGNASRGGINPMQVGLGANVASIDINMGQGVNQRTDRPLDAMVSGEGFFIVGQGTNTYFTRDGNFGLDGYGNFTNTSGLNVMGWPAVEDINNPGQYIASKGQVSPISLTADQMQMPPNVTTALKTEGNVNVTPNPNSASTRVEHPTTFTIFDSIGNMFTIEAMYVWDAANDGTKEMQLQVSNKAALNGNPNDAYEIDVTGLPDVTFVRKWTTDPAAAGGISKQGFEAFSDVMTFTTSGVLDTAATFNGIYTLNVTDPDAVLPAGTYFGEGDEITLDSSGITIFDNIGSTAQIEKLDGNAPGTFKDVKIEPDGSLRGIYTNGEQRLLAKIPLAKFSNPSGLQRAGGNLFQTTSNSGDFNGIGVEASDIGSSISSGQLEMSNVDIAQEFVDMITTQRGFQANSKSITTSDEMLQELVNLKR